MRDSLRAVCIFLRRNLPPAGRVPRLPHYHDNAADADCSRFDQRSASFISSVCPQKDISHGTGWGGTATATTITSLTSPNCRPRQVPKPLCTTGCDLPEIVQRTYVNFIKI
jgi:hypothetical protein